MQFRGMFAHGKRSLFGWEVSLAGAPALPEGKERSPPSLVCPSLPVSIPFPVARGAREYLCGSERTQLMGSGKRVERRCLPRQALMMFSPFLWRVGGRAGSCRPPIHIALGCLMGGHHHPDLPGCFSQGVGITGVLRCLDFHAGWDLPRCRQFSMGGL